MQEEEERRTARRLERLSAQTTERSAAPTLCGDIGSPPGSQSLSLREGKSLSIIAAAAERHPVEAANPASLRLRLPSQSHLFFSLPLSSFVLRLARAYRVFVITCAACGTSERTQADTLPAASLLLRSALTGALSSNSFKFPLETYTDRDAASS